MATIRDVAQMAEVSIATVSNYLNHTKPVKKATAKKIQQAIDQLQYSPNISARSLKSNDYPDIGVILPNLDNSYYVQIFQGIENGFQNSGYFTNLAFSYDIPDFEHNILRGFLEKQIRGLIIVSCQPDNQDFFSRHFSPETRPLVLIDRDIENLCANYISFDNYSMVYQITADLLRENSLQPVLITGPQKFSCEANSIHGFENALSHAGLVLLPDSIIQTNLSREDGFRKTTQLLRRRIPSAIITTSESLASGIIEGLTLHGYSQEQIPVYTLGEEHWNYHTHSFASFSSARPAIRLGQTAANLLLQQLREPLTRECERVILQSTYPIREKSAACPFISDGKKVLRLLMVDTPQVHAFLGLIKDFENQSGISTRITILPHHQFYESLMEKHYAAQDASFDVFMYDIPWLSSLAAGNILADITDDIRKIDTSIFLPDCLQYFSAFQNRYYGVPFMYAPQILYYRKDLFENTELKAQYEKQTNITLRPPRTWKEFNTISEFFTHRTSAIPYGTSIPAAYSECLAPEIYTRIRAFGGRLFNKAGELCLDDKIALQAYDSFLHSVQAAKPDYRSATDVSVVQDFLQGDTAMLITYPSFLTDVVDLQKSSMIGSIGYYHIPGRSPLLGGWSLGISSRSELKNEAVEFLKWTCDQKTANYFALLGGQTAITSTYTNDELVNLYPWLPLYYSTYAYTRPVIPPRLKNRKILSQTDIDSAVCEELYAIMDGKQNVQDALAGTKRRLQELLESC